MRKKQKNQKKKYCKINNKMKVLLRKERTSKKENSISCCSVYFGQKQQSCNKSKRDQVP